MPVTTQISTTQNYTIPEDIFSLRITLWGAGGGGEFIGTGATLPATAGSSGGSTSFIGLVAGGGGRGGGTTKNSGGAGGTASTTYNWVSNHNATVTLTNGNGGTISNGGAGLSLNGLQKGAGGSGTTGAINYSSNVFHVFNNETNVQIITNSSADIIVGFESPEAPNNQPCTTAYNLKHYNVQFVVPFVDNSYSITISNISQTTAAGGTGVPINLQGFRDKTRFGFRVWFCRNANSYVRSFDILCSGIKEGAAGRGGGGGAGVRTTLTRQMLLDSVTYAPNTSHAVTIGAGGARGGTTAVAGSAGYALLYAIIIPRVTLTASDYFIVVGQSVTLSWSTTGDADQIEWVAGGINNTNLTSSTTVSPQQTTTYTAKASGLGGDSPNASVTIVVYQVPTASITVPESLNYGENAVISYTTKYANSSLILRPYYSYIDGSTEVPGDPINLPIADSAENGKPDSQTVRSNNSLAVEIPYNDFGPSVVKYILEATGSGGSVSVTQSIEIIIDQTPDNIIIPEKEDAFKSQDPVFAPETEVLSDLLLINDIDIPIEIKSNAPIQVDINGQNNWNDVRQL